MREILFRGKRVDKGEWVFGYYAKYRNIRNKVYSAILQGDCDGDGDVYSDGIVSVIPETVGQYTGKTDKNNTKIFEGDRVLSEYGTVGIVEWDNEECSFIVNIGDNYQMLTDREYQIIGNIYDNFELLQEDMK